MAIKPFRKRAWEKILLHFEDKMIIRDIYRKTDITTPCISELVKEFENRKIIKRIETENRRVKMFILTKKGKKLKQLLNDTHTLLNS